MVIKYGVPRTSRTYRSGAFGVKLVLRGTDDTELDAAAEEVLTALPALGGNPRIEEATT